MIPRATYRLQFQQDFGFDRAAEVTAYLALLGVSHIYASPWLKARSGSTHGYDIVDHSVLNPELGDEAAFHRLRAAMVAQGLGQILDFVPNHMGIGGADNPLWLDVLEWGPDSTYAEWFDIDWRPDRSYLRDKILAPFLAGQYGVELQNGKLLLKYDEQAGAFAVWAYDVHKLPICPLHYGRILGDEHAGLERIGDAFANLAERRPDVARRAEDWKAELARASRESDAVRLAITAAVNRLNGTPGRTQSWRDLNALIQDQHWRAAHFRVAADDINYRRFFDINNLAGIQMELPEVFDHAHRFVLELLRGGTLDGLRIDHVDGLLNPREYLQRLRDSAFSGEESRSFYLVVEKVLAPHEQLRADWPVDGSTGYDFANLVLGLLIDSAGEESITRAYTDFSGETMLFAQIVRDSKIRIMENEMASELHALARDAARIARQNPITADFTQNILRRVIQEVVACFPVYRTYVDDSGTPSAEDRRYLDIAIGRARSNAAGIDSSVFDFAASLLSGDLVARPRSGFSRHSVLRFAMKLQQFSGPVMAKGLEDTAFYRYNRFVTLNEVGGRPDRFGISLAAFHQANEHRAKQWPRTMLCTSTHDTKRGEDARARLAVLSEIPGEWTRQVKAWSRILHASNGDLERLVPPDRNDEYLFYQLLIGTWPAELTGSKELDSNAVSSYSERLEAAMLKSIREAKIHSTWAAPDSAYEEAVVAFVRKSLRSEGFLALFLPFQERVARLGVHNSLVQTVLKLTLPGVPDIYQGAELWDLSLVDPDNRRLVDYSIRTRLLEQCLQAAPGDRQLKMRSLFSSWRDGAIKLAVVARILHFRRARPDLFSDGCYDVINARGAKAGLVCAFARRQAGLCVLTAAARFPASLERDSEWSDTHIPLPEQARPAHWLDILTGSVLQPEDNALAAKILFHDLPVAVLTPAEDFERQNIASFPDAII